ncbi:MAG: glycosyltransferase family 2 protein, partial [Treponema sp.]|nr:glycosyltransferase family 2 protein [Treponema sp.]
MKSSASNVFIVLVSYNAKRFLDACIGSLLRQDRADSHIVMVDNASPDDSNAYIEEHFPEVTLLKEPVNYGFGKACNIGAKYALEHGAEFVLFLNTDTEADTNLVTELVEHAGPDTVTTCFTYNDKDTLNPWYAGGRINRMSLFPEQALYPYDPSYGPMEVEFISGCCMMMHRDVFEKVGFFDESYFMYVEDVEYCMRLMQYGIKLLYIQSTKLLHIAGGSSVKFDDNNLLKDYYITRNNLILASQHPEMLDISVQNFFENLLLTKCHSFSVCNNKISYERKGIEDFLKSKTGPLETSCLEFGDGFSYEESDGCYQFRHCISPVSYARICNYSDTERPVLLSCEILPEQGHLRKEIIIRIDGRDVATCTAPCWFDQVVLLPARGASLIEFITENTPVNGEGDPRSFFFIVRNPTCKPLHGLYVMKSCSVSPEEVAGQSRWSWVTEKSSSVAVWNFHDGDRNVELKAMLAPPPL